MKSDKLEPEEILEFLAEMRKSLPPFERNAQPPSEDTRTRFKGHFKVETQEDLEWAAVIEAAESLADEIQTMVDQKRARLFQDCMTIYYALEEQVRDPEHAHLIPLVEKMREAYKRDFGVPIPPKGK